MLYGKNLIIIQEIMYFLMVKIDPDIHDYTIPPPPLKWNWMIRT